MSKTRFFSKRMEKNNELLGVCEGYTFEGAGVVKEEGFVLFVPGLLKGEKAKIVITAMKKSYGYGRVVEILEPSTHRVTPQCDAYRLCGGCNLAHMDQAEQHAFKMEKIQECFLNNAHQSVEPRPILYAPEEFRYRNKVQVPVQVNQGKVEMGFYQPHSNHIIPFTDCLVQTTLSNEIVAFHKEQLQSLGCGSVFRHVLIRHAHHSGQVMVVWIVRQYPFPKSELLQKKLLEKFPQINSLIALVNRRSDNVILDGDQTLLYGQPSIEETLLDATFQIQARSFFQVNPYGTKLLYQTVLDAVQGTGKEIVVDLYCGTGTIGILAAKKAKKVYGIEIVEDAVKDARENAKQNSLENIEFLTADATHGANLLLKNKIHPDTVIVDPPRKGCNSQTLEAIVQMKPKKVVYVSCDPATLARDIEILQKSNYQMEWIQPVDMFPQTTHVETVVLLSRKAPNDHVEVSVNYEQEK